MTVKEALSLCFYAEVDGYYVKQMADKLVFWRIVDNTWHIYGTMHHIEAGNVWSTETLPDINVDPMSIYVIEVEVVRDSREIKPDRCLYNRGGYFTEVLK